MLRAGIVARWLGPVVVGAAGVVMLVWSWGTWPDPLVDFGQQLYVSWQIAEGKLLYRDLAYLYGPLSPYLNAIFLRLFGVSLTTLVVCNLAILAGLIGLLYRMLADVGGRFAATLGGLTFVTVFAFGQLVEIGNYNFVCPYVYGVTHGLALSLLAIYAVSRHHRQGGLWWVVVCGFGLGLVALAKAEILLAAGPAVVLGLGAVLRSSRARGRRIVAIASLFLACVVLPLLAALLLLGSHMPYRVALDGMLGTWPDILGGELLQLPFYRWSLGIADAGASVRALLLTAGGYLLVLGLPAALALRLRRAGRYRAWIALAVFAVTFSLLLSLGIHWPSTVRPLPLVMLGLLAPGLLELARRRREAEDTAPAILRLMLIVFSGLLLAKIVLNVRTFHYGFALAMPATLLFLVVLLDGVPRLIRRAGGFAPVFIAAVLAVWGAFVLGHLGLVDHWFARKTVTVASRPDTFRADWRGTYVNQILAEIERVVGRDETLAVLPIGVMINYLTRRFNPSPYLYFMPSDLIMYGEGRMLESLRATPPDYVLLVHKDTSEFGYRFLGRDYGVSVGSWIRTNYRDVYRTGGLPFTEEGFGMLLLRRIEPIDLDELGP